MSILWDPMTRPEQRNALCHAWASALPAWLESPGENDWLAERTEKLNQLKRQTVTFPVPARQTASQHLKTHEAPHGMIF